ncbi:hypothetical protein C2W62_15335 [Candidatus Entotheonella serta]|nr:hypothetical protein C2W62_15335 [Candidatus Entotheonella serta]
MPGSSREISIVVPGLGESVRVCEGNASFTLGDSCTLCLSSGSVLGGVGKTLRPKRLIIEVAVLLARSLISFSL